MSKPKPFKGKCSSCGKKKVLVVKYKNAQLCIGDCLVRILKKLNDASETIPFAIPTPDQVIDHYGVEKSGGRTPDQNITIDSVEA